MSFIRVINKLSQLPLLFIFFLSIQQFNFEVKSVENNIKNTSIKSNKILNINANDYLLGPGDSVFIDFPGITLFSSIYAVDSNGYLTLPELKKFFVNGITPQELQKKLNKLYLEFIIDPSIIVSMAKYRPLKIYLSGEIRRPGLYNLKYGQTSTNDGSLSLIKKNEFITSAPTTIYSGVSVSTPRVFDALVLGRGITKYADLKSVEIIRNNSQSKGGGKIKANVDILSILEKGDQSQNIVLRDGDNIHVPRSQIIIRDQLLKINKTNLTPDFIDIYVNGNVEKSGKITLNQGVTLFEAIATVGGKKSFTGNIEFIRFDERGNTEKKILKYNPSREQNEKENPLLANGDIIIVRKNLFGKSTELMREISTPFVTGLGLYGIFN
tara:strand:- start:3122 stop:4267 length:1146 start_codon:yes stop_codon:yes gene_type:complete